MVDTLTFKLVRVVNQLRCKIGRQLKHLDMTSEQWGMLLCLSEQEGLNQKELAEKLHKDQANTTRILDKLGKKGWIQRVDALDDRRAYLIYLTDAGRHIVEEAFPLVANVQDEIKKGLTGLEMAGLKAILDRISHNIG